MVFSMWRKIEPKIIVCGERMTNRRYGYVYSLQRLTPPNSQPGTTWLQRHKSQVS